MSRDSNPCVFQRHLFLFMFFVFRKIFLYWWVGLNHRPDAYKASALTTELHQYFVEYHTGTPFGNYLMDIPQYPSNTHCVVIGYLFRLQAAHLMMWKKSLTLFTVICHSPLLQPYRQPISNRGFTSVVLTHLIRHPVIFNIVVLEGLEPPTR